MEQASLPLELRSLPLEQVSADPRQVRKLFDKEKLDELAQSIRDVGIVQPIVVAPLANGNGFRIISGERRHRAALLAGIGTIPAVVRSDLSTDDARIIQLVENIQREDLSLPEVVAGVSALCETLSLEEAAQRLGKSKSWISKRNNLGEIPKPIYKLVEKGEIRDVEIARDLAELHEVDPKSAQRVLDNFKYEQPDRESLRNTIKYAKEDKKRREQEAKERAKLKADGKDKKKPQEPSWEREQRLSKEAYGAIKDELEGLASEARTSLLQLLGDHKPGKGFAFAVAHRYSKGDYYGGTRAPKTLDAAKYSVELRGGSDDAGKILAALKPAGLAVELGDERFTVDEIRKIESALERRLHFTAFNIEVSAKHLAALSKKKLTKTAPAAAAPSVVGAGGDVAAFLKACTDRKKGERTKAADVHAAYAAWCGRHDHTPIAFNDNAWGEAIAAAGINKIRSDGIRYEDLRILVEA